MVAPGKVEITESYIFRIKENFLTPGLADYRKMNAPKEVINSNAELAEFIKRNFEIRSRKSDRMMKIEITFVDGKLTDCITNPRISEKSLNKPKDILSKIDALNFDFEKTVSIDYKIEKIDL